MQSTISLNEIYRYIFQIDEEECFLQFMEHHKSNYEQFQEYFPLLKDGSVLENEEGLRIIISNPIVDIALSIPAMSHLFIELRNYHKGSSDLYKRILDCQDKLEKLINQ